MRKLAALILLITSVACIPPEPDDDLIVNYDPEETVMGEIQQRGELLIGVPRGKPPFDGFTAELGSLIADALGVDPEIVPLEAGDMITAPEEGRVDISFPLITITEKLVRRHAFTDPYYIAHQRLLVREGAGITRVDDLSGLVCQYITEGIGADVDELNPEAAMIAPPAPEDCVRDLAAGRVEALTSSDWLLYPAIQMFQGLEVVGDDLTTEAYGAVVEAEASAWSDLVNSVFAEAEVEGDWQRIYDEWFGPLNEEAVTYPELTIEEAAALFPNPAKRPSS